MLDSDDWLSDFDAGTLSRSRGYATNILRSEIEVVRQENRVILSAYIKGLRMYHTTVHFDYVAKQLVGRCSCPVGYYCKHAAALAIAARGYGLFEPNPSPLTQPAKTWLAQLTRTAREHVQKKHQGPSVDKSSFIYVLQSAAYAPRELFVQIQKITRLKDGSISKTKAWSEFYSLMYDDKTSAQDKNLINALQTQQRANTSAMSFGRQAITGIAASVVQEMAQTGRMYWQGHQNPPIFWQTDALDLSFKWDEVLDNETVRLEPVWSNEGNVLSINADDMYIMPSQPPIFLDSKRARMGLLQSHYPIDMLSPLLHAPSIPMSMVAELESALDELPEAMALPVPAAIARLEHYGAAQPALITMVEPSGWRVGADGVMHGFAQIAFDYEGGTVFYGQSGEVFKGVVKGQKVTQHRNRAAEQQAVDALLAQLPIFKMADGALHAPFIDWLDALTTPDFFEQLGWTVRHAPHSPLGFHQSSAPIIELNEHNDWFGLGMHIEANGQRYDLSELLGSMVEFEPRLLDTEQMAKVGDDAYLFAYPPDGHKIMLRMGDIRPILTHLTDLFNHPVQDGELRLDPYDALRLLDLQHTLGLAYGGSARLQTLIDAFKKGHEQQLAAPDGFVGTLRPYQEKGLAWLQFLRESEHGGILADDMGLGKTAQTLAHIQMEKNAGRLEKPALIVAPTSLMHNWRTEAARFTPNLRVLVLQGAERVSQFEHIQSHDIVLTTYPLLPRDEEILLAHNYHLLVLDEAQNIKNPIAKAAQVARKLSTRHRLCLTGTPMENHLGELWSLYHFLMPGFLGSQESFNRRFRHPIEKRGLASAQKALVSRIRPFMLRRRKTEVAKELPPKTTTVVQIEMGGAQQKIYEAIRAAMQASIQLQIANKGFKRSHIEILDALLKLRQVCCHPTLLKMDSVKKDIESAKLKALVDMVVEMVEEGRRILIFSQFTTMLGLIEQALSKQSIDMVKLTGQTKKRAEVIEQFQTGDVPVFLISLKAGGVGLNLTAADTVIHYDPWWNPAAEEQASDRAWRIGQDKPVFVYKLIIAGSIEEKIIAMQERKAALTNSVISDDGEMAVKFSEEELLQLFAPIE